MNYDRTPFETDKPGEECGVFGAYDFDGHDISSSIYYGLFALQHRGQESCGIAVSDTEGPKGKVDYYKDMGLVPPARATAKTRSRSSSTISRARWP